MIPGGPGTFAALKSDAAWRLSKQRRKFMMELKLYYCAHCGNIVYKVVDKGVPVMCCGEKMQ